MKSVFVILVLVAISSVMILMGDVYMHELAHVMVYAKYGVESRIYLDFPLVITEPTGNLTGFDFSKTNQLHLLNEIVGYNTQSITTSIVFFGFMNIIMLALIYERI